MKKLLVIAFFLMSYSVMAGTSFSAHVENGNLLIQIQDDHLIPPFEAGDLWKVMTGTEQLKMFREKEMSITCEGFTNQMNDTIGNCSIVMPYNQFQRIDKEMVFKATGNLAMKLNRHFTDSAYVTMQRNQIYLSAYNTRNLFFFGIAESLIQK